MYASTQGQILLWAFATAVKLCEKKKTPVAGWLLPVKMPLILWAIRRPSLLVVPSVCPQHVLFRLAAFGRPFL